MPDPKELLKKVIKAQVKRELTVAELSKKMVQVLEAAQKTATILPRK